MLSANLAASLSWNAAATVQRCRELFRVAAPTGYSIVNATSAVGGADPNIQIVTVTVSRDGEEIYETSTLKVNR